MRNSVYNFLVNVLGEDGAKALQSASKKENFLEALLVPRAALAWIESQTQYEGVIPGTENTSLNFHKTEDGYTGNVNTYKFKNTDVLHLASVLGVLTGVSLGKKNIGDKKLVDLGKSIDLLVKAQFLFKKFKNKPKTKFVHT